MATASLNARAYDIPKFANGVFTADNLAGVATSANGDTKKINLGFYPRYVRIINETDVIIWEKTIGMTAANAMKTVTAGTLTTDTGSHVLFDTDPGLVAADANSGSGFTITLDPTAVPASKRVSWVAWG
jgi:hypothetical protein